MRRLFIFNHFESRSCHILSLFGVSFVKRFLTFVGIAARSVSVYLIDDYNSIIYISCEFLNHTAMT